MASIKQLQQQLTASKSVSSNEWWNTEWHTYTAASQHVINKSLPIIIKSSKHFYDGKNSHYEAIRTKLN